MNLNWLHILQVESRETIAPYEVEMKIINFNVEDVFELEILPRLERVIRVSSE